MLRRIVLSITLLVSMVVVLPLVSSTAHNLRFQFASSSKNRVRRHSRAWWRRHRAMIRRRQALAARRRAMAALARNGVSQVIVRKTSDNHATQPEAMALPVTLLPNGWSTGSVTRGTSSFNIASANGTPEAQATLAVVASASANAAPVLRREQRSMLGGVSHSDLRRNVIDRMISAGGWVVNDRSREIGGNRVFQVIAQTPGTGDGKPEQVWNFYFTEVNGRIYSLTTRTTGGFTEKLATDSEKFLSNFKPQEASRNGPK